MISPGNPECVNGGYCYDGTCYCSPGYGGRRCEIRELCCVCTNALRMYVHVRIM